MARTVLVNFRLDETDKQGMERVCEELGISMSAAFAIFAKKVAREKRIPFDLCVDPVYSTDIYNRLNDSYFGSKSPNAETIKAIKEAEEMERHPERYKSYGSVDDLMEDLLK